MCIYKALYIDALCLSRKSSGPRRGDVFYSSSVYSPPRIQDGVWMKLTVHPRLPSLALFFSLSLQLRLFSSSICSIFFPQQEHSAVGRSSIEERRTQKLCLRQIGIDSRPRNPIGRLWDSETASPKQTGCLGCQRWGFITKVDCLGRAKYLSACNQNKTSVVFFFYFNCFI